MTSKGESERRGLPAGWEWREDEDGFAVRLYPPGRNDLDYAAVSYRDGSFVAYLGADTSEEIASADLDEPCTPETRAAAQRAAEAALWARDGFGVGEVRGVVLGDEWTVPVGLALDAPKSCPMALPGLPGLWTLTRVSSARPIAVDAVRVPFDTQAEADAAPLTHALDAEGNALCPYDPATLAYVSPRHERVTCPACIERVHATAEVAPREPSAPSDPEASVHRDEARNVRAFPLRRVEPSAPGDDAELVRLLPDLPHRIAYAREAARDEEPLDVAIRELADGCELLLAERAPLAAERDRWKALAHKACADACDTDAKIATLRASRAKIAGTVASVAAALDGRPASDAEPEVVRCVARTVADLATARARVAELEAERATPHTAWTCTTCGISGTTEMLADDGAGPVCPECRQARHLCMHEPAGYRVAALLAELKRMREEGDGGMREAIDAVREHLTAPSPLDLAAAEVCAVDAAEVADTFDAWAALGDICRAEADGLAEERAQFAKAGRVALAGMLACDASAAKEPG